jgi:hypothetical protein
MVRNTIKIEENLLLKIEEMLIKKRNLASKKMDLWRKRNEKILKNWNGIRIIRFFREKR